MQGKIFLRFLAIPVVCIIMTGCSLFETQTNTASTTTPSLQENCPTMEKDHTGSYNEMKSGPGLVVEFYQGKSFTGKCVNLETGTHNNIDLHNLLHGEARSIRVQKGYTVVFQNKKGASKTIKKDEVDIYKALDGLDVTTITIQAQ